MGTSKRSVAARRKRRAFLLISKVNLQRPAIPNRAAAITLIRRKLRSGTKVHSSEPILTEYDINKADVVSTGWEGRRLTEKLDSPLCLEKLRRMGFRVVRAEPGETRAIVATQNGRPTKIIGAVHGPALGVTTPDAVRQMNKILRLGLEDILASTRNGAPKQDPRGEFSVWRRGFGKGQGSEEPLPFRKGSIGQERAMDRIVVHPRFKRLARHMSDMLAIWAPRIHKYVRQGVNAAEKWNTKLQRPFKASPYPAVTVNFGPQTVCKCHRDRFNLACGLCAITALGKYNPKNGGHIVLWELKLIVEFAPGTTVLIPSAFITHGNIPIAAGETRYSFTQYAAGTIYRWVYNGKMSNTVLFESWKGEKGERDKKREREYLRKQEDEIWKEGVERFSPWKGLRTLY